MSRQSFLQARGTRSIVGLFNESSGFTLVELLIVLIIIALLVGIVVPSISGFLGRGREESFNGDKRNLQVAVDAYYTDTDVRVVVGGVGYSTFPTEYRQDGAPGLVTQGTNVIISMPLLVNRGYIRELPHSAAPVNGGPVGHYIWIIDGATGTVYGCAGGTTGGTGSREWWTGDRDADCGYDGQYP